MNLRAILATLWLLAISVLSIVPIQKGEGVSAILDLGHIGVYTILAILWSFALKDRVKRIVTSVASIPITEFLQLFIPWRKANLMDIANNALGVILGLLAFTLIVKVTQTRKKNEN
jgi:VanZ family protein